VVTTHLGALKTLASDVPGVINGSLEFDAEQLRPTFRFVKGVPGRSYGLAIARRLGVDSEVLAAAEALVPDGERSLDELLSQVEARARSLEEREREVAHRIADLETRELIVEQTESSHAIRERDLRRQERDAERQGRAAARKHLLDARSRVEEAIQLAQGESDAASRARRMVEDAARVEAEELEQLDAIDAPAAEAPTLEPGQRVRLGAGAAGTVLERRTDGKVLVAMGSVKVVVAPSDLTAVRGKPEPRPSAPRGDAPSAPDVPDEIDLRGLTGDEAQVATIAALDAAVVADKPMLRIIHGMGTGVVRNRVRDVLQSDRRVARFDFAPRQAGGTGVTIAELGQ
jgi:DNA mismatch repair protein MutS2